MDDPGERLVAALYDSVAGGDGWNGFLEACRTAIGAQAVEVTVEDFDTCLSTAYGIVGVADEFRQSYDPAYVGTNPWVSPTGRRSGPTVRSSPACDPANLEDTDYYRNWLRPQDLRYMAGTLLHRAGPRIVYFSALKSRHGGPFTAQAERIIEALRPHLSAAVVFSERFGNALAERDLAFAALDAQPQAMLLADADGGVAYANAAARTLLPADGALFVGRYGRLVCRAPELRDRLAAALRQAARPGRTGGPPMRILAVPRESAPPLQLLVQPFAQRAAPLPVTRQLALLTLVDPQARPAASEKLLAAGLGLTAAEGRLAAALAEGESLAGYADRAGIRVSTARTLLRRAMARTGARRQADLVRQVTLLAGGRNRA